jgi:hypothetical protein
MTEMTSDERLSMTRRVIALLESWTLTAQDRKVLLQLPEMPEANSIDQALEQAANLGRINQELSAA